MEYILKLKIQAKDDSEKKAIGNALLTVYKHLNTDDLVHIASEIQKDPSVIRKVRKIANNPLVKKLYKK